MTSRLPERSVPSALRHEARGTRKWKSPCASPVVAIVNGGKTRVVGAGALGSLGVTMLWTSLAALNPITNYHLSPLIAVFAASTAARLGGSGPPRWPIAITVVGVGLVVTVTAATSPEPLWKEKQGQRVPA